MIALWISALGMLASIATAFFVAPEEASQGIVQKIFYIHVSSAMTMYLGFFISFLSGIFYLAERKTFWDELGCAVVVVEHDMPLLASVSDRFVALEAGSVVAEGAPAAMGGWAV